MECGIAAPGIGVVFVLFFFFFGGGGDTMNSGGQKLRNCVGPPTLVLETVENGTNCGTIILMELQMNCL